MLGKAELALLDLEGADVDFAKEALQVSEKPVLCECV